MPRPSIAEAVGYGRDTERDIKDKEREKQRVRDKDGDGDGEGGGRETDGTNKLVLHLKFT